MADRPAPRLRYGAFDALGAILIVLAFGQLAGAGGELHYRGAAIALAAVFAAGGLALIAFAWINRRWAGAGEAFEPSRSPKTVILAAAAIVMAGLVVTESLVESVSPLSRLILWYPNTWASGRIDAPQVRGVMTTLLSGTIFIALGTLAITALSGAGWAAWVHLRGARAGRRQRIVDLLFKPAYALLWLAGSVPYLVPALLVRARYGDEVTVATAQRFLANGTGTIHAFSGFLGIRPALLFAVIVLGLQSGHALVTWLRRLMEENRRSESYRVARLIGRGELRAHLRDVVWLRKRGELMSLLIGSMASAGLIDMISNALIDSFHKATFPLYPSLGSVMFLAESGLAARGMTALVFTMIAATTVLIVAASIPEHSPFAVLRSTGLWVGDRQLARDVPSGSVKLPAFNWVLGTSGAGKSSYLRAYAAERNGKNTIFVPQDPDEALDAVLSTSDLAALAGAPELRDEISRMLMTTRDGRIQQGFDDPYTAAALLSRGERQRLIFVLALARFASAEGKKRQLRLLLDEFTSAQDEERSRAMSAMLSAARLQGSEARVFIVSHDPLAVSMLGRCVAIEPCPAHARGDAPAGTTCGTPVTDVLCWVSGSKEILRIYLIYDEASKMARATGVSAELVLPEELERFRASAAWIFDHDAFTELADSTGATVEVVAIDVRRPPREHEVEVSP